MAVLLGLVAETFLANRRGALPPTEGPGSAATPERRPATATEPPPPGDDIAEILAKL
jgi:hypothetical protein